MTLQEIFSKVRAHLLTQNVQCVIDKFGCAYRGPNDTKCAAGCLIPDEMYNTVMETVDIVHLVSTNRDLADVILGKGEAESINDPRNNEKLRLLRDLQFLHDKHKPNQWPELLLCVASCHGLVCE